MAFIMLRYILSMFSLLRVQNPTYKAEKKLNQLDRLIDYTSLPPNIQNQSLEVTEKIFIRINPSFI